MRKILTFFFAFLLIKASYDFTFKGRKTLKAANFIKKNNSTQKQVLLLKKTTFESSLVQNKDKEKKDPLKQFKNKKQAKKEITL